MKKLICCFVIITIILSFSVAFANETFDAGKYTLEELYSIWRSVEAEIQSRVSVATATLMPGRYVSGVDIKPGAYILIGLMDKAPNGSTPQALVAESLVKQFDYVDNSYMREGQKWHFTLQDGMVLEIRNGECSIQQAAPFIFAP